MCSGVTFLVLRPGAIHFLRGGGCDRISTKEGKRKDFLKGLISIDNEKRVDWNAIRAEYIGGGISYRQIAKKYGIPFGTVRCRAQKEQWVKEREHAAHNVNMVTSQILAEKSADNAIIFERMRKKALLKLERELDAVLEREGTESRHTETYFSEEEKRTISDTTISKLADILALMEKIAGAGFGTNEPQLKAIREILDGVPSAIN